MIITIQFYRISIPQPQCMPLPPKLSPLETISFSKSVSQCLFCKGVQSVIFQIPHVSESIWCWCLIVWLTSLSMIISRSIHVAAKCHYFFPFNGWVCVPHLLDPLLCWWTFRLFPCLGYWKECCNEHWNTCVFLSCGVGHRCGLDLVLLWRTKASSYSSNLTPSLGISVCHKCGPKFFSIQRKPQLAKTNVLRCSLQHYFQ